MLSLCKSQHVSPSFACLAQISCYLALVPSEIFVCSTHFCNTVQYYLYCYLLVCLKLYQNDCGKAKTVFSWKKSWCESLKLISDKLGVGIPLVKDWHKNKINLRLLHLNLIGKSPFNMLHVKKTTTNGLADNALCMLINLYVAVMWNSVWSDDKLNIQMHIDGHCMERWNNV